MKKENEMALVEELENLAFRLRELEDRLGELRQHQVPRMDELEGRVTQLEKQGAGMQEKIAHLYYRWSEVMLAP